MKMLKKMAALLLAGVMAMALLTACGDEAPSKSFAQQTEETVFSFYSKALGVEKNDADMKKLAEKTLGYIDEDGVVTIHEDMVDSGKPEHNSICRLYCRLNLTTPRITDNSSSQADLRSCNRHHKYLSCVS